MLETFEPSHNIVEIVVGIGGPNWRNDMRVSGLQ